MHDTINERFIWNEVSKVDPKQVSHQSSNLLLDPTREIILHLVTVLYVHDIILNCFRNDNEMAMDLIKQIAVSHALMKVTPEEFRVSTCI